MPWMYSAIWAMTTFDFYHNWKVYFKKAYNMELYFSRIWLNIYFKNNKITTLNHKINNKKQFKNNRFLEWKLFLYLSFELLRKKLCFFLNKKLYFYNGKSNKRITLICFSRIYCCINKYNKQNYLNNFPGFWNFGFMRFCI